MSGANRLSDLIEKQSGQPGVAEDDLPPRPPPPVMTWDDIEQGRAGQLSFPLMTPVPTAAERVFLVLAREWLAEVEKTPTERLLPRDVDERALSCLLLAVEWGREITSVARDQMETNQRAAARRRKISWTDRLSWDLCLASWLMLPPRSEAVRELTGNLDHPNSSIRVWMMEMGWFVAPWLNRDEAAPRLLKNLADTLCEPLMAAGLAARLFDNKKDFFDFAGSFVYPDDQEEIEWERRKRTFTNQYESRLKMVKDGGILRVQAPFWQTEALCRKTIEQVTLGVRIRKVGNTKDEGEEA